MDDENQQISDRKIGNTEKQIQPLDQNLKPTISKSKVETIDCKDIKIEKLNESIKRIPSVHLNDVMQRTSSLRLYSQIQHDKDNKQFHLYSLNELKIVLGTNLINGITQEAAKENIAKYGKNKLIPKEKNVCITILKYFIAGFCILLWVCAILCVLAYEPFGEPAPNIQNIYVSGFLVLVVFVQALCNGIQDYTSNQIMSAIMKMMPSEKVTTIRDGVELLLEPEDLALGDLVFLHNGMKVPADIRMIEAIDMKLDKSMVTGETDPVDITVERTSEKFEQSNNIAFMTNLIVNGHGKGLVIATGNYTQIGLISEMVASKPEESTNLQKDIISFVWLITWMASGTVLFVLIIWLAYLRVDHYAFMSFVSLISNEIGIAVSFIPEGLPIAVSLTLLITASKMSKKQMLIKNLPVIETLGCINVICSDKTGTLTENKMYVEFFCVIGSDIKGPDTKDESSALSQIYATSYLCNNAKFLSDELDLSERKTVGDATDIALLKFSYNKAKTMFLDQEFSIINEIPFNSRNKWMMKIVSCHGQNTENATLLGASPTTMLIKGAPDKLLNKCSYYLNNEGVAQPLGDDEIKAITNIQNEWSEKAMRVILLAKKELPIENEFQNKTTPEIEKIINEKKDFCVVGILGLVDPPRKNIAETITGLKNAGLRVFMVTGDFKLTAIAIAKKVGLLDENSRPDTLTDLLKLQNLEYNTNTNLQQGKNIELVDIEADSQKEKQIAIADGREVIVNTDTNGKDKSDITSNPSKKSLVLTGDELVTLTADDWKNINSYDDIIFSRVSPEQKLNIVAALQTEKNLVGVTGDGINDAPALKCADIGIAMGCGTDLAIESSHMVLLNNEFSGILSAIQHGRLAFINLRKVIIYGLAGGGFAEIFPAVVSVIFGIPLPISTFQMIYICVFTDIPPEMALILETPESNLLAEKPRKVTDKLVTYKIIFKSFFFFGVLEVIFSHFLFFHYLASVGFSFSDVVFSYEKWSDSNGYKGFTADQIVEFTNVGQSIFFTSIALMQVFGNLPSVRTFYLSLFQSFPLGEKHRNIWVPLAQIASVILVLLCNYLPFLNNAFGTRPISVEYYFYPILFGFAIVFCDELLKLGIRCYDSKK